MESFQWTLRASASAPQQADVFVRKHRFEVGLPLSFDVEYDRVTALEHVLGAFGADLAVGLWSLARKQRVKLDNVEVVVRAELHNPLVFLGVVGEEGDPGLKRIEAKVYASALDPVEDIERVWEEMCARSPLVQTFKRVAELDLTLKVT